MKVPDEADDMMSETVHNKDPSHEVEGDTWVGVGVYFLSGVRQAS
jgi:hypothetical protein